jgi:iron(III) transport system ATP-binding protein
MAQVEINALDKAFGGKPVLAGVDLALEAGGVVAILGASGSGKTTLLRLICGFERADAGSILLEGRAVAGPGLHVAPEQRAIGYVAQEGALFPHLSVAENILFGLPRAARGAAGAARAAELLELVGLPGVYAGRGPAELSGGEQQRVALARALAPGARLVLLDEPFSALDAALRAETRAAVTEAVAAAGATALLVTHDQAEALSMGKQVAVLRAGRLVQVAAPEMLYRQPVDAALAQFVGDAVLLPGVAQGRRVSCCLGTAPLLAPVPDGPVQVMLRPEQLLIGDDPAAARARVSRVIYYGHDASVALTLAQGAIVVTARVAGHRAPAPGAAVSVAVDGAVMAYPCGQ